MPFPADIVLRAEAANNAVFPCSLMADWTQVAPDGTGITLGTAPVYAATGPIPADANYATANTKTFKRENGMGTTVRVRLVYDNAHTAITSNFQYILLGRRSTWASSNKNASTEGGATAWQVLPNKNGNVVCTLAPDLSNDIKLAAGSNTVRATLCDAALHSHDNDGCDEFWLIPVTALAVTNGAIALDRVEVKII